MKYRVHLFAVVRVEQDLEANTPEEAACLAFQSDLDLYRRFDKPGQEYAEQVCELCLVDPLSDEVIEEGQMIPDYLWSQWFRVREMQQSDGTWRVIATPAQYVPDPRC